MMHSFTSDGIELAYIDEGVGDVVLLIHGFASNVAMNWTGPGWVKLLTEAGYRFIAFDNRGHGQSEKLYNLEDYGAPLMAEDAKRLLAQLDIERAHVMGYSMGARISAFLAMAQPELVRSCVFGGLGGNMIRPMAGTSEVAQALEAPSVDEVTNEAARAFRLFAQQTGSDLRALATCIKSARAPITGEALAQLTCPVLVAVGSDDEIGGSAGELADLIPKGEALVIPGRDHMKAVGDHLFKERVLPFFQDQD
jgi:pimeloyl-ACP methyl ester carboxylesterase